MNFSEAIRLARSSFAAYVLLIDPSYIMSPFHLLLANKLEAAYKNPGSRLMVSCPPRHGKSRLISELFPSWVLGVNPYKRLITTSYNATLANDFGSKVRELMNLETFKLLFPYVTVTTKGDSGKLFRLAKPDDASYKEFSEDLGWYDFSGNTPSYRGQYVSTGIGGSVTGKPGDLILVDDPIKNRKEADSDAYIRTLHNFFKSDLYTRLEPGGSLVIVHTRFSKRDLIGYCRQNYDFEYLRLPALADNFDPDNGVELPDLLGRANNEPLFPEKYDYQSLIAIREAVGESEWNSLYQQNPISGSGSCWNPGYVRTADFSDKAWGARILSIDTATELHSRSDYTAIQVADVIDGKIVFRYAEKRRVNFPMLLQWYRELKQTWRPSIKLVEKSNNGTALIQSEPDIIPVSAKTNKKEEFAYALEAFDSGLVYFDHSYLKDDGLQTLEQLSEFPGGTHDDLVISAVQLIRYCQKNPLILELVDNTQILTASKPINNFYGQPKNTSRPYSHRLFNKR